MSMVFPGNLGAREAPSASGGTRQLRAELSEGTEWVYGGRLFVVSARTNKWHHHHRDRFTPAAPYIFKIIYKGKVWCSVTMSGEKASREPFSFLFITFSFLFITWLEYENGQKVYELHHTYRFSYVG